MADEPRKWRGIFVAVIALALGYTALFGVRSFLPFYRIPTGGMERTVVIGDHVLVNPRYYRKVEPERTDIVVHDFRGSPFMQRVVGLPGETVEIRDKVLFINGAVLEEPYAFHSDQRTFPSGVVLPDLFRLRDQFGPYVVPSDHYFVMGDNRDASYDWRYTGAVARANLRGKVIRIFHTEPGK